MIQLFCKHQSLKLFPPRDNCATKFPESLQSSTYLTSCVFLFTLFILGIKIQFNAPYEIIKY